MKLKCGSFGEFVRVYVCEWQVLSALAIPLFFALVFPVYWLVLCPQIWAQKPELFHPRSWLVSYWLFASFVWLVFLVVCFYRTRSGQQNLSACHSKTDSTEDLWSEDQYLPDSYLPSPDYLVSVSAIQPPGNTAIGDIEEKHVVDETWDYNYEETGRLNRQGNRFPFEQQFFSLRDERHPLNPEATWRKYSEPFELYSHRSTADISTEDEGDGGRNLLRGPFLQAHRKRVASGKPRPHSVHHVHQPRLPQRSTLNQGPPPGPPSSLGGRRPSSTYSSRHLRPVRYDVFRRGRPTSCLVSGGTTSSNSSTTDVEPFSESTPPLLRKSCLRSSSRHLPPPRMKQSLITTSHSRGSPPHFPPVPRHRTPPEFRVRKDVPESLRAKSTRSPLTSTSSSSSVTPKRVGSYDSLKESLTDEELQSLQDVCQGKVERKDSLVTDQKFDHILASLQSLAVELERDFVTTSEDEKKGAAAKKVEESRGRKNSQESMTDESSITSMTKSM